VSQILKPSEHDLTSRTGTFFNSLAPQNAALSKSDIEGRLAYQTYLASFAMTGNPNKNRNKDTTIEWPLATGENDPMLSNVLKVASLTGKSGLSLGQDEQQQRDRCSYYTDLAKAVDAIL
jgi:hypothetical protein